MCGVGVWWMVPDPCESGHIGDQWLWDGFGNHPPEYYHRHESHRLPQSEPTGEEVW
jgi:hypothetical protein